MASATRLIADGTQAFLIDREETFDPPQQPLKLVLPKPKSLPVDISRALSVPIREDRPAPAPLRLSKAGSIFTSTIKARWYPEQSQSAKSIAEIRPFPYPLNLIPCSFVCRQPARIRWLTAVFRRFRIGRRNPQEHRLTKGPTRKSTPTGSCAATGPTSLNASAGSPSPPLPLLAGRFRR